MRPIKIMINGLPGNMATIVVKQALADGAFDVLPYSLTGPEIEAATHSVSGRSFELIHPTQREAKIAAVAAAAEKLICIDYTHPTAVVANAAFYCQNGLPFVMGTTGGDRKLLEEKVCASAIPAVIAPNMAKQIVGFQAMMAYAAETFPGLFGGFTLAIKESHQKGKADTSGTAKAMVAYFNAMGVPFTADQIAMERDPDRQAHVWHIPAEYLTGHGWHTYALDSQDETVHFEFTHNVNGREVYAHGTLDAVKYLYEKVKAGIGGQVFSMIDVLKGK
jgi:4-hydroxy-tetrahydrodipicolinate reductase